MSQLDSTGQSLGLVVLNYNNAAESIRFLKNVSCLEEINAIQIVDNASTDGSNRAIEKYCHELADDRIAFVQSSTNGGYGSGNNLGVRKLLERNSLDYILIANPDTYFNDAAIRKILAFLGNNCDYAAAAPLMANPKGEFCQSGWMLPNRTIMFKNAARLFVPSLADPCDYGFDYGSLKGPVDVEVLPGSFFLIRADVFERVGGFDEDTFLYGEENLLFFKVRDVGYKCALVPECAYTHAHGTSINKEFSSVKNRYLMLLKSNLIYGKKALGASRVFLAFYALVFRMGCSAFAFLVAARNTFAKKAGKNKEVED